MSALYNLEPQPTAKVVLNTTAGDLSLELFAKQTPLASRNFLQHCLDGYYTGTIFHRLVPGFILQGGDPTGTGAGGQTADDKGVLEDEIHSRLKFNRRGLLGMAKGEDGYGSQFFLTLGETRELQGVMTMFGRIEGETIYNLMKMGEAELVEGEGSERPLYPVRITGAEILVNPFEGMVARVREAPRVKEVAVKETKKRKKVGKNVLSFGGGDEEGEDVVMPVVKKVKANPKLVSAGFEAPEHLSNTAIPEAPPTKPKQKRVRRDDQGDEDIEESAKPSTRLPAQSLPVKNDTVQADDDEKDDDADPLPPQKPSALDRTNAEIAALKASMKRTAPVAPNSNDRPKNALEAMIPATSIRGRKRGAANKAADEKGTFNLFQQFKQRLEDLPAGEQAEKENVGKPEIQAEAAEPSTTNPAGPQDKAAQVHVEEDDEEAALCDLHFIAHCQSCRSWADDDNLATATTTAGGDEGDEDGPGWMAHRLTFAKDTLGKDLEWRRQMEDSIEVIDPREKAREILMSDGKRKGKWKGSQDKVVGGGKGDGKVNGSNRGSRR